MNTDTIPSLTLCIDAAFNHGRFAITTLDGTPVWFGRFFERDGHISNSATAEKVTALKAVWLAGKVRETLGAPNLHLRLMTDAQWLTMPLGQAKELHDSAAFKNLRFQPCWIKDTTNPADSLTRSSGFQNYDLETTLAAVISTTIEALEAEKMMEADEAEASCHRDRTDCRPFKSALHTAQAAAQAAKYAAAGITPQAENEWLKANLEKWNAQKAELKAAGKLKAEIAQIRNDLVKAWIEAGKPTA